MIERHIAKLRARHEVSEAEEAAVRALMSETRSVKAGARVVRADEGLNHSTLLLDGWLARSKFTEAGTRQISELHVAGDFADLHSFTLKQLDHDVVALTDCLLGLVPHDRLQALMEAHPRLARLYWFSTNLDAAIHREWEMSLGRRRAEQRVGALACELHTRLKIVGLADEAGFGLPLTQQDLSDCLGLTPVHVNRTLRLLRERELMTFRAKRVNFMDLDALKSLSDFSDNYLYLRPKPL